MAPRTAHALLFAVGAALALRPLGDPDVWWHLAAGRDMARRGALQPVETPSFTSDVPFVDVTWLWDLATHALASLAGEGALLLLPAVLVGSGLVLGARAAGGGWATLAGLAAALVYAERAWPRPDLAQVVLAPAMILGLRAGWPAGLVLLLWPQVHGSFPVGWLLLACAIGEAALRGRPLRGLLAAAGLGAIGILAHPAGPGDLLRVVAGQLHRDAAGTPILEWMPPDPARLLSPEPNGQHALVLLAIACVVGLARAGRSAPIGLVVPAGLLLLAAAGVSRAMPIAAAVAWPAACAMAPAAGPSARVVGGVAALLLLLRATAPEGRVLDVPRVEEPAALLADLARATPADRPGRALVWFDLGAVLAYRLGPAWQVSVDSRAELAYSPEVQAANVAAHRSADGLAAFLARWPVDAVVTPSGSPACRALAADAAWTPARAEAGYALFLRDGPRAAVDVCATPAEWLAACRASPESAPAVLAELEAAADVDPDAALGAGLLRFACLGDPDGGLAHLDRAAALAPGRADVREARYRARSAVGDTLGAGQDYVAVWRTDPRRARRL